MQHLGRGDGVSQHFCRAADLDLHHTPGKTPIVGRRFRKEYFEELIDPCPRAWRACNQQRPLAACKKLSVEQEERKRTEMVPVQMRKQDAVDTVGVEAVRLERDQRRGAEVDQKRPFGGFEKEAGIEPATGAEGITRSHDGQAHGQADALGRTAISACQRVRCLYSSGTASVAGFMKSMATRPVMSATVNASPAMNGRSFNSSFSKATNS